MSTIYDQYEPQTQAQGQRKSSSCLMIGIPIGCLGILLVACAGVIGSGFFGLRYVMNETTPINESFERVQTDPRSKAILGEPISKRMSTHSKINYNNGVHTAEVDYDVYGPDGSGKVTARATRVGEDWDFTELTLEVDGTNEVIDLEEDVLEAAERSSEIRLDE